MKRLQINFKLLIVIFSILLGFLCIKVKLHGWFNIIPWSISALIIGFLSKTKKASLINGAVFGYLLFVSYIFFGYKGNTEIRQYASFVAFTLFFSLVGSLSGLIGSFIGYLFQKKNHSSLHQGNISIYLLQF